MSTRSINDPTLVLVCRRPAFGVGKRRLAIELGDALTLELSRHMLAAALEDLAEWPGPRAIAIAESADEAWARTLLDGEVSIVNQQAGNLGQRLETVDRRLRAQGHHVPVFIGSDAPALSGDYYMAARAALSKADVVLGPATDGGVTLLASHAPWPPLANLAWGSNRLGSELEAACHAGARRVKLLEIQYDIDHYSDLRRLGADLAEDRRPARIALRDWIDSTLRGTQP